MRIIYLKTSCGAHIIEYNNIMMWVDVAFFFLVYLDTNKKFTIHRLSTLGNFLSVAFKLLKSVAFVVEFIQ